MTPARKKRLGLILLMVAGVATGVGFALKSLDQNIMFFFTPSEVAAGQAPADKLFRYHQRALVDHPLGESLADAYAESLLVRLARSVPWSVLKPREW